MNHKYIKGIVILITLSIVFGFAEKIFENKNETLIDGYDEISDTNGIYWTTNGLAGTSGKITVNVTNGATNYVTKYLNLNGAESLSIRLYLDPNDCEIDGDHFRFLQIYKSNTSQYLVFFMLSQSDYWDEYYVEGHVATDDGCSCMNAKNYLFNSENLLEIKFWRSSSETASNGGVVFSVDGTRVDSSCGIDNYDIWGSDLLIKIGVANVVSNSTGSIHLDEIVVRNDGNSIGDINTLMKGDNDMLCCCCCIGCVTNGEGCAIEGYDQTFGDGVFISTNNGLANTDNKLGISADVYEESYVASAIDLTTSTLSTRFYIDTTSLEMGVEDTFRNFELRLKTTPWNILTANMMRTESSYFNMYFNTREDDGVNATTSIISISDGEHFIENNLYRASGAAASDGYVHFYIDGTLEDAISNLDNYDIWTNLNEARIGIISSLDEDTSGTLYMDELLVKDHGEYIGAKYYMPLIDFEESDDVARYFRYIYTPDAFEIVTNGLNNSDNKLSLKISNNVTNYCYYYLNPPLPDEVVFKAYIDFSDFSQSTYVVRNALRLNSALYALSFAENSSSNVVLSGCYYTDSGFNGVGNFTLTNRLVYFEAHLKRASSDNTSDGYVKLYTDGELRQSYTSLDNYDIWTNNVSPRLQLGNGWSSANMGSGAIYFDQIRILEGDHIGSDY